MPDPNPRTERLHALDSLRGIMMMLGLVLHSAVTYGDLDLGSAWSLKDPDTTSQWFDLLSGYIHAFRMPIFFAVGGFFGALLFYERSPRAMVMNRVKRLVLPFAVSVFLLWPVVVFAWTVTTATMKGSQAPLAVGLGPFTTLASLVPSNTMHLWFLLYLIFFSAVGYVIALLFQRLPGRSAQIRTLYEMFMYVPWLRPLLFAGLTFGLLAAMGEPWPEKTGGILPTWAAFLNYGSFYLFGWLLFGSKHYIPGLDQFAWSLTVVGAVVFFTKVIAQSRGLDGLLLAAANALVVWLFLFGICGLFVRYFSGHSPRMRYVSDASYWFYLIHLPLTALIPASLMGTGLPVLVKFVIVLGATTVICWASYAYLVRGSFVGVFLNGRRFEMG